MVIPIIIPVYMNDDRGSELTAKESFIYGSTFAGLALLIYFVKAAIFENWYVWYNSSLSYSSSEIFMVIFSATFAIFSVIFCIAGIFQKIIDKKSRKSN